MRHRYLFLVVASCGFQTAVAPGDAVPPDRVAAAWTLDAASDFAATGHTVASMTVDPRGSLTPDAYTYGGLVAHGLQGRRLWTSMDTAWSNVDGVTPSGAGLWRGESYDDNSVLEYLGITDRTVVTIWLEGEVFLQQGSNQMFLLHGNDVAFVEIAAPGTARYARVPSSDNPVAVATPETGWYPIRIGFADNGGSRELVFQHSDGGTPPVPWARNRLRARTSALRGALRTVCNRQILAGGIGNEHPVSRIEPGALLQTAFNTAPQGTDVDNTDWSARYVGQLYVDQPGTYTLAIDSDDGNRGRLGTARDDDAWLRDFGKGDSMARISATLTEGWNDLFVDYNQVGGMRNLSVRLTGGGLSNAEVPRDRLRPVESADDRLVFATDDTDRPIIDGAGQPAAIAEMRVAGFADEVVTAIDFTYQVESSNWTDLEIKLERPGLDPITIRQVGVMTSNGSRIFQLPISMGSPFNALLRGSPDGLWRLHVDDLVPDDGNSTLQNARLTLHTAGGPPKVAMTASWTSQVLDATTDVLAIDRVTWDERAPQGASVKVFARTCQQAACSDEPTWAEAVKAMPVGVARGRYLQLRVDMTSDGVREPELHRLEVAYVRSAG